MSAPLAPQRPDEDAARDFGSRGARRQPYLRYGDFAADTLCAALERTGWVIVGGVPCWPGNTELLALAAMLGTVRRYGPNRGGDPTREGESVHRVAALPAPQRDESGRAVTSTTADRFPLHTDEAVLPCPGRYVLLHCWGADRRGGTSLIAPVDDFLHRLDRADIEACYRVQYRWGEAVAPILTRVPGRAQPLVRFGRHGLAGVVGGAAGDAAAAALADRFGRAAAASALRCRLRPGDCLIADNRRVLHGRTRLEPGSHRLLKRLRVKDPSDPG